MKPIKNIIVRVHEAYKTKITTKGGLTLFMHQSLKQVKDTVRFGEVIAIPSSCKYDIKVGDTLFFHHNIVGITLMDKTEDIQSKYLINKEECLYSVPIDDRWPIMYATIRDGNFSPLDGICFVRKTLTKKYNTDIYIPDNDKETLNIGEMVYPDKKQIEKGIISGTKVIFEKDSEYSFTVGDEELYCMFTKWIVGMYEG